MAKQFHYRASVLAGVIVLMALAGCGDDPVPQSATDGAEAPAPSEQAGNPADNGANESTRQAVTSSASERASGSARSGVSSVAGSGARNGELTDPSGYDMYWVYVDWTGNHPDYGKVAERNVGISGNTYDNQTVNEFNRADLVAQERARLESLGARSRNIGFITTNIGGRLGDYDPGYGEFYVDPMSPGSSISFSPTNWQVAREVYKGIDVRHVKLRLTNALDGYVWKLSPAEAEKVIAGLEREGNVGRQIYARAHLQILGVAVKGDMPEMNAKVLSYSLHTERGTLLREVDLNN